MTIFNDEDRQLTRERATAQLAIAKPTRFMQNAASAWREFRNNDDYGSLREQRREAFDWRIRAVKAITGEDLDNPWSDYGPSSLLRPEGDTIDPEKLSPEHREIFENQIDLNPFSNLGRLFDSVDHDLTEPQRLRAHEAEIERIRRYLPADQRAKIPTAAEIEDRLAKRAKELEARNADIASRSTIGGAVGQFAGASGAAITQPEVLATLPIGASSRAPLLARMLQEAVIAGATEGVLQPGVQGQRAELGLRSGIGPALENVGTAAGGAGAFTGALSGINLAIQSIRKGGVSAFEKIVGREATPDEEALIHAVENDADMEAQSPYESRTLAADRVRLENETLAYQEAMEGRALGEDQLTPEARELEPVEMGVDGSNVQILRNADLGSIEVDADLMQFKSGGDDQGVTDRLQGITEWKPERAGLSLVYEFADGRRLIADGHQRLGLARRLAAEGQEIQLPAIFLRESDGVTPAEARAIAAFKNIAEGTGSALDAAKVLRDSGATAADLNLPPKSALVRDAEGLMALDDDAFRMVINDVISQQQGAIVGRLVADPRLQPEIAKLLARLRPANATEAESIVRQALEAGQVTERQATLFGEEDVVQSLYLERARVLDRGLRMIRRNIDTFRTLDQRGVDIESAGNVLNESENARRLDVERMLKAYLEQQAHRKGVVGDALSKAAKKARDEGNYAAAAREFVAAIGRAVDDGTINGADVSGRGTDPQPDGARQADAPATGDEPEPVLDESTLQEFSDPVGPAADQQAVAISGEFVSAARSGNSIVAVRRETGEVIGEFFDNQDLPKFDQASVALVRAGDYLPALNREENSRAAFFKAYPEIDVETRMPARRRDSEATAAGDQTLIDGVRPVTDGDRARVAAEKPMQGGDAPADFGLFDISGRGQGDLLDMPVPTGERIDADGKRVAETTTLRDMLDDLEQDQEFVEQLNLCDTAGAK